MVDNESGTCFKYNLFQSGRCLLLRRAAGEEKRLRRRTRLLVSNNPRVKAKVKFVAPDQGGRSIPAHSGTRSELKVNDLFTSCIVRGETDEQVFKFDVEYDVTLELLFWDRYKDVVHVGMLVQLNEGNRTAGLGRIEAIEG